MLDYKNHIDSTPSVMLGKPVIKGTRITVELILRKLADGFDTKEIIEMYPHLKMDDVLACLTYAALVIENEELIKVA